MFIFVMVVFICIGALMAVIKTQVILRKYDVLVKARELYKTNLPRFFYEILILEALEVLYIVFTIAFILYVAVRLW